MTISIAAQSRIALASGASLGDRFINLALERRARAAVRSVPSNILLNSALYATISHAVVFLRLTTARLDAIFLASWRDTGGSPGVLPRSISIAVVLYGA